MKKFHDLDGNLMFLNIKASNVVSISHGKTQSGLEYTEIKTTSGDRHWVAETAEEAHEIVASDSDVG